MDLLIQFGGGFLLGLCAAVSPGPDTVLVLRSSAAGGRRAGMRAALGIGAGLAVHAIATLVLVLCLNGFADNSLLRLVQMAGAFYLGYLGLSILFSVPDDNADAASANDHRGGNYFVQGFVTNLTNPKAIVFFASVVSQFVAVHHGAGAAAAPVSPSTAASTATACPLAIS